MQTVLGLHTASGVRVQVAAATFKTYGLRAGNNPMATHTRRPGERHGSNWYIPNVCQSSEFRHVAIDANAWKTFVHARLATAAGDRGAMTLFGKNPEHHTLFAEHVAESEYYVITEGQGRTVHEWKAKPSKTDNHWLDCLVGCAVAASMQGCVTAEMSVRPKRDVKRTKFSQLVGERS